MNRYFAIPHALLVTVPPLLPVLPTGDYNFAHDRLRFWAKVQKDNQDSVLMLFEKDDNPVYAIEGPWISQLESCIGGCTGGGPPS